MRADDRCDEIAYVTGAMVEDAVDSEDRRRQIEFYVRSTQSIKTGKPGESHAPASPGGSSAFAQR
jgi:hypothetical protein